jgi:lipopolysaccharide transport system permease protein
VKTSALHLATPASLVSGLLQNRDLLWELVKRDFIGRYKGSIMGVVWSLFNPLLMLAIYATVFSVAFKARWGTGEESKVAFALVLFSGMIVHSFFAECLNRAPALIVSHPNYVKKVVFPLDLLPCMALCSALLHFFVSFIVLLLFCVVAGVPIHSGVLLVPFILLPLVLLTLGLSWILASLGVYLRDLSQIIAMISSIALFMAPVFYPIENLPEAYRQFIYWNPITLPIIQLRDAMLWNKPLQWDAWLFSLAAGTVVCFAGYWWFQKSRRGFADVL